MGSEATSFYIQASGLHARPEMGLPIQQHPAAVLAKMLPNISAPPLRHSLGARNSGISKVKKRARIFSVRLRTGEKRIISVL